MPAFDFGFGNPDEYGLYRSNPNRYLLSNDPSELLSQDAISNFDPSLPPPNPDEEKKKRRRAGIEGVLGMLPSLLSIITAKTSDDLQRALGNSQEILQRRAEKIAEQKAAKAEMEFRKGMQESSQGFQKSERIATTEAQVTENEKERTFRAEQAQKGNEFSSKLAIFNANKDKELAEFRAQTEKDLKRMGQGYDVANWQRQVKQHYQDQLVASDINPALAAESATILANGGSFSQLDPAVQVILHTRQEQAQAKHGADNLAAASDALTKALGIPVPVLKPDGTIQTDAKGYPVYKPLLSSDILGALTPEAAKQWVDNFGAKLPFSDQPSPTKENPGRTVAEAIADGSLKEGADALKDATIKKTVDSIGKANLGVNAAGLTMFMHDKFGGNQAMTFGFIEATGWNENLKNIAREALRKRLAEDNTSNYNPGMM